ncbi:virulence protein [uncultured Dysosmobacter sp.]|uniref:virulence protein n=1 Tax=uncultured Dysosmobacter sp. TaxID=2591384 RepID=UPI0026243187|nr:virulence protein [uncultured Dysosmobacter sp.]
MTINYNVTGSERKRLADCIAGFLGCEKKYLGVPSCAYQAGYIEVSKDGTISFDDGADSKEIEALLEELGKEGFHAEPAAGETAMTDVAEDDDTSADTAEDNDAAADAPAKGNTAQDADTGLTVEIPLEKVAVGNLTRLLDAKGSLIRKALGIENLGIEVTEDTVKFPWFPELPDPDEVPAYTHFIAALCAMSKNQKRVTATAKEVDNEKYAFRCFLLRLGFIGAECKAERKILLKNLSGSSAFKSGRKGGVADAVSE